MNQDVINQAKRNIEAQSNAQKNATDTKPSTLPSNTSDRPNPAPTRKTDRPTDINAAKGAASNAIAKVNNKSREQLQNVEHYITRAAEQREDQLEQYASAIAYLNDGNAFLAELAAKVEQKLGAAPTVEDENQIVDAGVIDLDSLDPYSHRTFKFKGQFFSASPVGLLGGN